MILLKHLIFIKTTRDIITDSKRGSTKTTRDIITDSKRGTIKTTRDIITDSKRGSTKTTRDIIPDSKRGSTKTTRDIITDSKRGSIKTTRDIIPDSKHGSTKTTRDIITDSKYSKRGSSVQIWILPNYFNHNPQLYQQNRFNSTRYNQHIRTLVVQISMILPSNLTPHWTSTLCRLGATSITTRMTSVDVGRAVNARAEAIDVAEPNPFHLQSHDALNVSYN
ncbi:thioredoxin domain-containing protein 2 [Plakobranchus ocellatus]|uniref:Thioredoxin domain-containing protein 2 n=1 Tax=Plakobranchus ocellatus TaxID=259542 RepID=A0AAV3XMU8_9GAST|nr:thioredoxin domain-containing protein 2 [Plakobranchus ocellatus]